MAVIEFAPLNVPLERRLQTLAVLFYVFFFLIAPPLSIFIAIYLFFTSFWWITVLYGIWFIYDFRCPEHGSRPFRFLQNGAHWKYFAKYFPMELVKTADLSPDHNYIFGSHPHGVMSLGAFTTFCTDGTGFWEAYSGLKPYLAALNGQFWFPFRREFILLSGVISCSKSSLSYVLNTDKGVALAIVLGGAEEALDARHGCYDLLLLRRKGFIRLALETGAHLVPVYHFGENDTFSQLTNERGSTLRKFQVIFRRYAGFSSPIFSGRGIFNYTFGILPFRTPIHTVVGKPIVVEKNPNATREEVDRLHERYCNELKKLFDAYKEKYGIPKDAHLNFY
uniref:Acyltransferase n=1 Tax=Ascaris lumbricoides TaxID=6252 RepID=A0A0M3ILI2_ASCLU